MMKKKLVSMFLVVCMVLTLIPTLTFAAQAAPTYPPAFEGYQLDADGMEWEILRLVNIERAKVGVAPLQMTKFTQSVAQIRGQEMFTLYSHTRPDGTLYSTAFKQVLGKPYETDGPGSTVGMGENIAGSRAANPALISAGTFMKAWMNSDGHRENILRPEYKFIGIGVVKDLDTKYVYAVQNFAIDGSNRAAMTASWGEGAYNNTITNDLNKEYLTVTLEGTYAAAHGAALMPLDYSMVDTTNPTAPKINHGVTLDEGTTPDYDIGTNPPGGGGGSATIIKQPDTLFYKNVSIAAVDAMIADANNTQTTTAPFLLIWAWEPCLKSGDAAKYAHKIADENHLPVFVHTTAKVLDVIPENLLVQADVNLETGFSFPIVLYFDGTKWARKGQWGDGSDGYPAYQGNGKSIAEYLKKNNLLVEKSVFVAKDLEFEVDQPGTALIKMKDYLNYGYEMATQDIEPVDPKKVTPACVKLREEDRDSINGKEVGFSMVIAVWDGTFGDLSPKAFPTKSSTGFLEYLYGDERIGVTSHFVKIADTAAKLNAAFSGFKAAADSTSTHTLDIRLKADITGPVTIEADNDRSFTIDMNGFSINGGIVHKGAGKLTIKNATDKGTISAADAPAIHVTGAGSVELNGVTVTSAATGNKGTITFDDSGTSSPRKLTAKKSTITNTTANGYAVYLTGATFDKSETTITGKTFPENITVSGNTTLTYMDGLGLRVTVADPHGFNKSIRLCKGDTVLATADLDNKAANAKGYLTYATVEKGIPIGETTLTIQLYDKKDQNHVDDTETVKIKMAKKEVHGVFKEDTTVRFNGTNQFDYVQMEFPGGPPKAPVYGSADVICSGSALGPQTATTTVMRLRDEYKPWFTIADETVTGNLRVIKGQGLPVFNGVTLRPDATTALQHTFIDMPPQMGAATYTIGEIKGNVTATVADGVLSISPTTGAAVGQTASIPVTVASENYVNFTVTVKVKLLNKADVSDNITFAGASKTYTGSAITHEAATIAGHTAGANPKWTYTYVAGTGTLDGNGKPLTVGTYTVTATYEDADNQGAKAAVLTITKAESEVVPTPDTKTYTYGETITLTATVGIKTLRAAQDKVEFFAGETSLGTADVVGNKAELVYDTKNKGLKIGANTIKAVYGGSVNLNGSESGTITVTLQAKPLTGAVEVGTTKVYDGNASFANVGVTLTATESGDTITATAALTTADANVGATKAISTATVTLAGTDKGYYTAPATLTGTVAITKKPLSSFIVTVADKVYNGNTATFVKSVTSPDLVAGDALNFGTDITFAALFASADAAESAVVNISEITLTSNNYATALTTAISSAKISTATATVPSIGNQTIKRGKTLDDLKTKIGTVKAVGVNGEQLTGTLVLTCADFTTLTLGTHEIPFTLTNDVADTKWANYANTVLNGTITVEITALDPQSISFADRTKSVTYGDAGFTNVCTNETVGGSSITYTSSNTDVATVDANGAVTIVGAGSANITATAAEVPTLFAKTTAQYTLTVGQKTLTITDVTAQAKVYDATTQATLTGGTLEGVLDRDNANVSFTLPTATFDTANVGTVKAVTIGEITLTGTRSGNYTLTQPTGLTGTISKATPTLTLGNLSQQQNSSGNGVTAVTVVLTPTGSDAVPLVEYHILKTAAVGETPAVYEWTVTVPQIAGTYDVRATLPADKTGANLNAVTEPVLGTLTISAYNPPSSGGNITPPAPKPEPPKTDPSTGNTEVSVPVKPVTKGDTSSATVPEKSVSDAIASAEKEAAKTGGNASVAITVDAPKDAKTVETTLSGKSLTAVAEGKTQGLKISTPVADLHFDSEALKNIAGMAGKDVKISATQVDTKALTVAQKSQVGDSPVFDFTVSSGDKTISNFNGGTATVAVPYTPKEGEKPEFVTVWLLDDAGKLIPIEASYKDGKITFETGHFSRYAIGYLPFTDVTGHWAYESIVYAYQNKLFSGVGDDRFAPARNMNRAMLWATLYRMAGQPGKTDTGDTWYADAQTWAIAQNISDGKNPDGDVTREQLATILYRYAKAAAVQTDMSSFTDTTAIADFAKDGINWAVEHRILQGNQGKLNPQGNAARAEVATMLQRFAAAQN